LQPFLYPAARRPTIEEKARISCHKFAISPSSPTWNGKTTLVDAMLHQSGVFRDNADRYDARDGLE